MNIKNNPTVWLVQTTYTDGTHETNAVYSNEESAKKFADFMKENDGTNGMFITDTNIREFVILD